MNVLKQTKGSRRYVFLLCLCFSLLSAAPAHSSKEIIFIANSSVNMETISKADIQQIFVGEKIAWSRTQHIELCILTKSDPLNQFLKTYTDMNQIKFKRHWKRVLFTGRGKYPKFFKNEPDIIQYVSQTEGAIGFISALPETAGVKVITPR